MAIHHSADQWRAWFLEFEQSNLTVGRFCESVGVSVQSFYKWRKRLKGHDSNVQTGTDSIPKFVPVSLPDSKIEIELPCGAIARVANDSASIRPLVEVLLELGAPQ